MDIDYAPIPASLTIAVCDTGKQRSLTNPAYNERRAQCEAACLTNLGVDKLRDATLEQLESSRASMEDVIYRRARHIITENERCRDFADALRDQDLSRIGLLMKGSHESLRDDYEVSCAELDAMAESAWAAIGCVGARMTGAGFGGACVALVRTELLADFIADTAMSFKRRTDLGGNFMACAAVDGARTLL